LLVKKELIVCTPDTLSGQPRLEGHRLTVRDIVWGALHYDPNDPLIYFKEREESGVGIDPEKVRQAILYCKERRCILNNVGHACWGCSLKFEHDEKTFQDFLRNWSDVQEEVDGTTSIQGGTSVYLGTISDLEEEWAGVNGWEEAEKAHRLLKNDYRIPATYDELFSTDEEA
jgi:hypothetical protein